MPENSVKRSSRKPVDAERKSVTTLITLPTSEYNNLASEADREGVSMSSLVREALSIRLKIKALNSEKVILATKNDDGTLLEVGPISILR